MTFSASHITHIQDTEKKKYEELKKLASDFRVINVGKSSTNEKSVDIGIKDGKAVPIVSSKGTYDVFIEDQELSVVRTDQDVGWDENLQVTVYVNGSEIDAKIAEIEALSEMRVSMYRQLNHINASTKRIDAMEDELNYARELIRKAYPNPHEEMRQVQLNTYNSKQYQAHSSIFITTILFMAGFLPIVILYKYEIISINILQPIVWIFLALAIIVIGRKIRDVSKRDNMNYDAYQSSAHASASTLQSSDAETNNKTNSSSAMCRGPACCSDGQRYDYIRHVCVEDLA